MEVIGGIVPIVLVLIGLKWLLTRASLLPERWFIPYLLLLISWLVCGLIGALGMADGGPPAYGQSFGLYGLSTVLVAISILMIALMQSAYIRALRPVTDRLDRIEEKLAELAR
jgi:hypothetical protein